MLLKLDPASKAPAFRQICEAVAALIEAGVLRPGARLTPTRTLARQLGLHRSTVVRAYEELRALGWLDARSGAYSTVRGRVRALAPREAEAELTPRFDWAVLVTPGARAAHALGVARRAPAPPARAPAEAPIDLERLAADPSLAPADALRRCFRSALVTDAPDVFDYGDPAGLRPLREAIARRMRAHGVSADVDEVLITAGAQHALDLALRALAREGDEIVVEAPTYGVAHALLRAHGVRAIEIPMADDGMDLDALERALRRRRRPRLVYTMPSFHNPTGVTTSQAHRERLLSLCERHRVPIVEDGFEEELKYFGKAALPIKSMDRRGGVLYVGAFSKLLFAGARVGWIVAPRALIELLTSLLHASSLAVGSVTQAALARFCRGRELEEHLRRAHRVYRRRMSTLLRALEAHLPAEVAFTRPAGGYTSWLTVPGARDDEPRLLAALAEAGVRVAPGSRFFGAPPPTLHARLSIACVDDARIEEGCRRLGAGLRTFLSTPARRSGGARDRAEGRAR